MDNFYVFSGFSVFFFFFLNNIVTTQYVGRERFKLNFIQSRVRIGFISFEPGTPRQSLRIIPSDYKNYYTRRNGFRPTFTALPLRAIFQVILLNATPPQYQIEPATTSITGILLLLLLHTSHCFMSMRCVLPRSFENPSQLE